MPQMTAASMNSNSGCDLSLCSQSANSNCTFLGFGHCPTPTSLGQKSIFSAQLHPRSHDCLLGAPFEGLQAQQGLLGGGDVGRLWDEQHHSLIVPTPLVVQPAVVPEGHLGTEGTRATFRHCHPAVSQLGLQIPSSGTKMGENWKERPTMPQVPQQKRKAACARFSSHSPFPQSEKPDILTLPFTRAGGSCENLGYPVLLQVAKLTNSVIVCRQCVPPCNAAECIKVGLAQRHELTTRVPQFRFSLEICCCCYQVISTSLWKCVTIVEMQDSSDPCF